jgi:hypothetical protein
VVCGFLVAAERGEHADELVEQFESGRLPQPTSDGAGIARMPAMKAADKEHISYSEFVTRLVRAQWHARQEGALTLPTSRTRWKDRRSYA